MTDLSKMDLDTFRWHLRRNLPAFATTFAPCDQGCGGSARAGGPCAACVRTAIATRFGQAEAARAVLDAMTARDQAMGLYEQAEAKP